MRHLWHGLNKPENANVYIFFGPTAIALGFTCLLNVCNITAESISFQPMSGLLNLIAAVVFMVPGAVMLLLVQDKKGVFSRVGLTGGLSMFFWGTRVANTYKTNLGLLIGWLCIILGIAATALGFEWVPVKARTAYRKPTETKE